MSPGPTVLYGVAPNTEAGENTAYNNVRVGRPPTQRNWNTISTGNASWRGPNIEKLEHQFQQAMQVGGPLTLRNWNTNFNRAMQVGGAPTQRNWNTNFYRQCKLGRDRNKFYEKYHFVLPPLSFLFQSRDVKNFKKK